MLALVLLASACNSTPGDDDTTPAQVPTTMDVATTLLPDGSVGTVTPPGILPLDGAPISALVSAQPIVAPGDTVTVTSSPDLSGQLQLTGPADRLLSHLPRDHPYTLCPSGQRVVPVVGVVEALEAARPTGAH